MNVYDFAMKMELDGKDFYKLLAKRTNLQGLKNIFFELAQDEQKHYELFAGLKNKNPLPFKPSSVLENSRNVFEALRAEKPATDELKDDLDAYRYAMKAEADSFRLYEEAAEKEPDQQTRALLLRIASEEQKHFNILQNVFDFVNAPHQYLAWGEFSNIDEFRNFGRDGIL